MSIKKANINWTVKTLCNQMAKGNINFDCAVQRGFVWDLERKSKLIHSLIYGFNVPPMFLRKGEDGKYESLDGKQRSLTIQSFRNNEFELMPVDIDDVDELDEDGKPNGAYPFVYDENGEVENISGMSFENLPEWAKDAINDYNLTIFYFENITDAEIREYFTRLNNGKPLSGVELTRVKAASIDDFQEIASHPVIVNTTSAVGKRGYQDELKVMQIFGMHKMKEPNFSTKVFRPWIETNRMFQDEKDNIIAGLDYVQALFERVAESLEVNPNNKADKHVFKKIKSRTHVVAISYAALLAIEKGIEEEDFIPAVYDFFNCTTTSQSNLYNSSVGAGSARAENVQKRVKAMQDLVDGILKGNKKYTSPSMENDADDEEEENDND